MPAPKVEGNQDLV